MNNTSAFLIGVSLLAGAACGSDVPVRRSAVANGTSCKAEGATAAAADGCNLCTCTAGSWQCTAQICSNPSCPPPVPTDTPALQPMATWVRDPTSERCCRYDDASVAFSAVGWRPFFSQLDCESLPCPLNTQIPAGDGCNTCTCDETGASGWSCSDADCPTIAVPSSGKECGYWQGGCPIGEYCAFLPGDFCSQNDISANCRAIPTQCTEDNAPVCSCSGKTYKNRCLAAHDGTGVFFIGPCLDNASQSCGGKSSATCPANQYCPYEEGGGCGGDGTELVCIFRPTACVSYLNPVCGCDRKVYGNSCLAAMAGVGVLNSGACP
jgi:hypothetical protein